MARTVEIETTAEVKLVELSATVATAEQGVKNTAGELTSSVKLADDEDIASAEPQRSISK